MSIHSGWWALIIGINIWLNVGVILFFYYCRLDRLEGYLEGVKTVEWNRSVCGKGYFGRQLRFFHIMLIVLMPGFLYKRGQIPKDTDKRIPKKLRWQMKVASIYMMLTALAMITFYFAISDRPSS